MLLIQFGHNDEKADSPGGYADPAQYAQNLAAYAGEAQAAGALPVLVTPLTRRRFDPDGRLQHSHGPYPEACRRAARSAGAPCIDLTDASRRLVEALGDARSRALYMVLPAGVYPAW
ncbi:MAG TPA: GDSL family lipase, partial [Candidatus Faecalibacterium faecipullorum]|nr:GDSL family lipase [Candidatus Faecalibacterium faecipullorum]